MGSSGMLPADFDSFLRSGSTMNPEMAAFAHGQAVVLVVAADDRGEQPRADDLVRLRAQVHREGAREQVGVVLPPAHDLRR